MYGSKHIRKPGGLSPTKEGWERPGAQLVLEGQRQPEFPVLWTLFPSLTTHGQFMLVTKLPF